MPLTKNKSYRLKKYKKGYRQFTKGRGRAPRPWLDSPYPPHRTNIRLYTRHYALIEALRPFAQEDLDERMQTEIARGYSLKKRGGYSIKAASITDILLFALEQACKRKGFNIEPIVRDYIAKKNQAELEKVLLRGFGSHGQKTEK